LATLPSTGLLFEDIEYVHEHADQQRVAVEIRVARLADLDDPAVGGRQHGIRLLGTVRGGSRKNWTMKATASHASAASNHSCAAESATATAAAIARNSHPSRAMSGCG
jgi:hypothetical protein